MNWYVEPRSSATEVIMKAILQFSALFALLAAPLYAASKPQTVTISQAVTAGSTQIAPGDYKVSWEGAGPAVKVTLAKPGSAPILLDAKLVAVQNGSGGVLVGVQNGVRVLQEIDLAHESLIFTSPDSAQK
jgi:hypothetical protein